VGAAPDAVLAWLRVLVTPTLSRAELVFAPVVVVAFLFHLRNSVVMLRLWRRLHRDGTDEELQASALDRLYRAVRGMLRLLCWIAIVGALATNWPYALAVFTFGILVYGIIEAVDAGLDWVYQYQRARYWERRDAMEDYAEQVAGLARNAAERAELAATAAVQQGERSTAEIKALVTENIELTRMAGEASVEAAAVANHMNAKLLRYGIKAADESGAVVPLEDKESHP
jgi:hypothetical protein